MKSGATYSFFFPSPLYLLWLYLSIVGSCYYVNRKDASGFGKYEENICPSVLELTPPDSDILP